MKNQIPNFFTLLNLLCGCVALVFLTSTVLPKGFLGEPYEISLMYLLNFEMAFWFVVLGILFDFIDGFVARLLNAKSALGSQLDSLADMVTSGLVPGFAMFSMLSKSDGIEQLPSFFPYVGFLITLGACVRLARFNIDHRQLHIFIGLPTPANALLIMSLPLVALHCESPVLYAFIVNPFILLFVILASVWLMNSQLHLFSLKFKNFSFKKQAPLVALAVIALGMLFLWQFSAMPLIIIAYIILSVLFMPKEDLAA